MADVDLKIQLARAERRMFLEPRVQGVFVFEIDVTSKYLSKDLFSDHPLFFIFLSRSSVRHTTLVSFSYQVIISLSPQEPILDGATVIISESMVLHSNFVISPHSIGLKMSFAPDFSKADEQVGIS